MPGVEKTRVARTARFVDRDSDAVTIATVGTRDRAARSDPSVLRPRYSGDRSAR
jgi:hypothetical protein